MAISPASTLSSFPQTSCPNCGWHYGTSSDVEIPALAAAVAPLLKSNEPAPSHLRDLLREAQSMASAIDSQIATLQASIARLSEERNALARLSEKRKALGRHIDAYKTVLHPIRSLPFDVFQLIFQHCVVESADYPLEAYQSPMPKCSQVLISIISSLDTKKSPWLLAQVSRRWKDVAQGCPTLWSSLTVEIPKRGARPGLLSLISLQLQRSRGTPLSVVVAAESEISSPLIALLCSHSSRWQLFCAVTPPKTLSTFASFLHGELPILESLFIKAMQGKTEWSQLQIGPLLHAFQSCYRLRWFRAVEIPQVLSISLPWEYITEISNVYSKPLPNDCPNRENLAILRQANSLQFARICCYFDASPTYLLSHSRLRGLHLQSGCKAVQDITQLLNCLVLPALEELVVCVGGVTPQSIDHNDGSILRFLARSSPPLETFILQDIVMSYTTFMEVFTALPKLRALGIYGITKEVLQALHWPQQSAARGEGVLPKLEQLHLYGPERDIDQNALVGMIESRFKPQVSTNTVGQMDASSGSQHPPCSSLALVQTANSLEYINEVVHPVERLITAGFKFGRV